MSDMKADGRIGVAIIGSGNIGTDLMYKALRNPMLDVRLMVGVDPVSEGLARAREAGVEASADGIDAVLRASGIDLAFDATSAKAHLAHAPRLKEADIFAIDLTPAAIGPGVVPSVNMQDQFDIPNVNMISCGAQATVPIVAAIARVCSVTYAETVSTVASASAGPGTRQNIDEFTRTTARAQREVGGAATSKSIIVLNPANPPIIMRNTVYVEVDGEVDPQAIRDSVMAMAEKVSAMVPGYRITVEPLVRDGYVTTSIEVVGAGDYLATYAGNLDIITSASVGVAESYAKARMAKKQRAALAD
ncbi:acetaldehyde-CoA dehydrogenase II, NAD-binding [Stutzerimonas xanthomarina]|nr:acetaldehyde-CoA dehydrogenase II, NAD-binding [Stutzerimonas xanthomarina]